MPDRVPARSGPLGVLPLAPPHARAMLSHLVTERCKVFAIGYISLRDIIHNESSEIFIVFLANCYLLLLGSCL